jgi:hypothetical protein
MVHPRGAFVIPWLPLNVLWYYAHIQCHVRQQSRIHVVHLILAEVLRDNCQALAVVC